MFKFMQEPEEGKKRGKVTDHEKKQVFTRLFGSQSHHQKAGQSRGQMF